jgi:predicted nucleic acid-binding OB-fold protein
MEVENILNAILVNEGVRSAMLIQPVDYGEITGNDKKTLSIVNGIKTLFPSLLSSDNIEGIIISKKSYDTFISARTMGEILGYPCYNDYETINRDELYFNLKIVVAYDDDKEVELFNNFCKDINALPLFKALSDNAFKALTKRKYKHILDNLNIKKINGVYVKIENIIPIKDIIDKLITKKKLSDEEKKAVRYELYNMGFTSNLLDFQYNNPIHIGILLDILVREKYNVLSPFYPLQKNPIKHKDVNTIMENLENATIDILNRTRTIPKTTSKTSSIRRIIKNIISNKS